MSRCSTGSWSLTLQLFNQQEHKVLQNQDILYKLQYHSSGLSCIFRAGLSGVKWLRTQTPKVVVSSNDNYARQSRIATSVILPLLMAPFFVWSAYWINVMEKMEKI
jgi:hypothetical protein